MTTTLSTDCPAGTFTEVVTGKKEATIQLGEDGAAFVHVGSAKPADASDAGLVIDTTGEPAVTLAAMETGDNVYVKPIGADALNVKVLHSDTAN